METLKESLTLLGAKLKIFGSWLLNELRAGYSWAKPRLTNRRNAKNLGLLAFLVFLALLMYAFVKGAIILYKSARSEASALTQSFGSSIALTAFYIVLPLLGLVFLLWVNGKTKAPSSKKKSEKWMLWDRDVWTRENEYVIFVFFVVLHIGIWNTFPEWFREHILFNFRYWIGLVCVIFSTMMIATGKQPLHQAIGKPATYIMVASLIWILFGNQIKSYFDDKPSIMTQQGSESSISTRNSANPNSHVQQVVYDILEQELPSTDAFKLTRIASCESGFRHFEDDGITPLRGRKKDTGEIVPTVKGVFQIKEDAWPELKDLGYNINRLEDNIRAAIWIHKRGLDNRWDCNEQVEEELGLARRDLITVVAPVGEWSEPLDVTTRYCTGGQGKHLWAKDDRGNEYELDPTKPTAAIPTLSFRFKAFGDEPETLEFTCVKK